MKSSKKFLALIAAGVIASGSQVAFAQSNYVSAFGGWAKMSDSTNTGELTGPFTTGQGTTIPAGVTLPAGTVLGWESQIDDGYYWGAAFGRKFGNGFRGEIEFNYQKNDVTSHSGVGVAAIPLDGEDAGVLITGSGNLGVSVGDLVADGQGSVKGNYFMLNGYYDFGLDSAVTPYVGGGIGYAKVDVTYNPSNVDIIIGDEGKFAYQAMAGLSFGASDAVDIYGQLRYRATSDANIDSRLLPAELSIENKSTLFELGLRYNF